MVTQRRLIREYKRLIEDNLKACTVTIDPTNTLKWNGSIFGPDGTDWEGAVFRLSFEFPADYPHSPPKVMFTGQIPFHPNVYSNGNICLDLLQHNWSSAYTVSSIITALQTLLVDPNPVSPANNEAAVLFTN